MEIILRKQAIEAGLPRYFTGNACLRGHLCERGTKTKCCVQCNRDRVARWQAENPEKRAAQLLRNRKSLNESAERSKLKNPEKYTALRNIWREQNRARFRAGVTAAKQKNPEKYRALHRAWSAGNRDKISAWSRASGAKRRGATGKFTKEDIASILRAQRNRCAYFKVCGTRIRCRDDYQVDHILAIARGGDNDRANLQILCPACNRRKGAKDALVFMRASGFLL